MTIRGCAQIKWLRKESIYPLAKLPVLMSLLFKECKPGPLYSYSTLIAIPLHTTHVECGLKVSYAVHDVALLLVGVDVLVLAGEVCPAHQGGHILEHGVLTPFQARLQSN